MDSTEPQNTPPEATISVDSTLNNSTTDAKAESTSTFSFDEVSIMAALSYVGPLVIIPFLTHKDNSFVMFHIKQGLVLFVLGLLIYVTSSFLFFLWPIIMIINIGLLCLSIVGIVRALQKEEKELPVVGKFAVHIKL